MPRHRPHAADLSTTERNVVPGRQALVNLYYRPRSIIDA